MIPEHKDNSESEMSQLSDTESVRSRESSLSSESSESSESTESSDSESSLSSTESESTVSEQEFKRLKKEHLKELERQGHFPSHHDTRYDAGELSDYSSSSSSSSSSYDSYSSDVPLHEKDHHDDVKGFEILKPGLQDIHDFYDVAEPSPVHSFANELVPHHAKHASEPAHHEDTHDMYERFADHNQDHEYFDDLKSDLHLAQEDVDLLKEIQHKLHPEAPVNTALFDEKSTI